MPATAEIEVDGLVRKTGLTKKNRNGKLLLKKEKIEWLDGTNQADSFEMFPAGLKAVKTECLARPEGKFCHEVQLQMAKGDDFTFTDAKAEVGGNESIKALLTGLKALYPKLPIVESSIAADPLQADFGGRMASAIRPLVVFGKHRFAPSRIRPHARHLPREPVEP
jgi:hypothetical protein